MSIVKFELNETQLAIFRRRQIGLIYQFYNLIPVLNVRENITLPLLLDETFAMYDDDRLRQTLRLLAANGSQTILFTCQRREQKLLEELGIAYHMIEL